MFCTLHECGWKKSDFDRHDECGYSGDATIGVGATIVVAYSAMLPDWDLNRWQITGTRGLVCSILPGDYHKAQEGSRMNGLNFFAERYTKIARNLYVWGSFKFTMDRESERAWSDVILKEYTSPYQYGGSVKGSYDRQLFDLKVKLATGEPRTFYFGSGVGLFRGRFVPVARSAFPGYVS